MRETVRRPASPLLDRQHAGHRGQSVRRHVGVDLLTHVDDAALGRPIRLGAALRSLPHGPEPDEDAPETESARREVDRLLDRLGWAFMQELGSLDPVYRSLVASMATLIRLGHPCDIEYVTEQVRLMEQVAVRDPDMTESYPEGAEQVEMAVASAVLHEPLLLSLRRPAQEEESNRRYGL